MTTVVFHIKCSALADGLIQCWWNGEHVIDFHGPTENQDEVGPVFKFRMYRDAWPLPYEVYFSNVLLGDTAESVQTDLR